MNKMHRVGGDLSALSDAELITSSRAGSDASFAVLYERHSPAAKAAARSLGASRSDVDDLVAEAFTRVLSALRRGGGPEVAFRPYLMTCVRNAWYDKARKDGRVDVPGDVPEDVNLALLNVPPDSEDARMVAAAFASLPERWQMVLWHTEVEGRPAAEVGPLLGLAPNAVAALAYRAREGLRQAYLQAHLQLPPPDACRDTISKLGAYVRDGLSARDRRKVDEHLKGCERCTAVLLELQEVSSSLRGVLVPVLLGVAGAAFLSQLGTGAAGGLAMLLRWRPRSPMTQAGVVAGTAAAVVAGVIGVSAITRSDSSERISASAVPSTSTTAASVLSSPAVTVATAPSTVATAPPTIAVIVPQAPPPVSVVPFTPTPSSTPATAARRTTPAPAATLPRSTTPATTTASTTTTTTAPATTTTTEPTTTTTAAPPALVPLSVVATPVGPAFAGLSATINVSAGVDSGQAAASLGRSLVVQAEPTGPVTLTASVAVLDWGVPGCVAGTTCVLATPVTDMTLRLDLSAVTQVGAAVPVTITASAPGAADAAFTVTLTTAARPGGLAYFTVDHVGLAMAANTVLTCRPDPVPCKPNNNDNDLGYIDVDIDGGDNATLDSSQADLKLPAGASIVYATLRWGGVPVNATGDELGTVRLTLPDGTTSAVTGPGVTVRTSEDSAYSSSVDVTATLAALADPNGTYTVSDVFTGTGRGQFGGWSLVVAYRLPSAPLQALALFDDPGAPGVLTKVKDGVRVALPGFATPAQVQVGVVGYEGDLGLSSDRARVGGLTLGRRDNFFRSVIDVGDGSRVPPEANQYGFDAQLLTLSGAFQVAPEGLTVEFTTTDAEAVYIGAIALVFPV